MSDTGYIPPEQRNDPPIFGRRAGCLLVIAVLACLVYILSQKHDDNIIADRITKAFSPSTISGLKDKAQKGDDSAALTLGLLYSSGSAVPKDDTEAYYWETIGPSYSKLLRPTLTPEQKAEVDKRVLDWRQKEAATGNPHAQAQLGAAYMAGDGVPKDTVKGLEWLHKGIDQGDGGAMNALGDAYAAGDGVTQDWQQAYFWYEAEVKYVHGRSADRIYEAQNHLTADQRAAIEKRAAEWKPGPAEK